MLGTLHAAKERFRRRVAWEAAAEAEQKYEGDALGEEREKSGGAASEAEDE